MERSEKQRRKKSEDTEKVFLSVTKRVEALAREVGNCVSWVDIVNVESCRHVVQCLAYSMLEGVVSVVEPSLL